MNARAKLFALLFCTSMICACGQGAESNGTVEGLPPNIDLATPEEEAQLQTLEDAGRVFYEDSAAEAEAEFGRCGYSWGCTHVKGGRVYRAKHYKAPCNYCVLVKMNYY